MGWLKENRNLIRGAVLLVLLVVHVIDENREKNLSNLLDFDMKGFESMSINTGEGEEFDWITDDREHAEALTDFLGQYDVKRMKDSEWNHDVSKEDGFEVFLKAKGETTIAFIYESRIHFLNDRNYYIVLNEPVDIEWMRRYIEEARK